MVGVVVVMGGLGHGGWDLCGRWCSPARWRCSRKEKRWVMIRVSRVWSALKLEEISSFDGSLLCDDSAEKNGLRSLEACRVLSSDERGSLSVFVPVASRWRRLSRDGDDALSAKGADLPTCRASLLDALSMWGEWCWDWAEGPFRFFRARCCFFWASSQSLCIRASALVWAWPSYIISKNFDGKKKNNKIKNSVK